MTTFGEAFAVSRREAARSRPRRTPIAASIGKIVGTMAGKVASAPVLVTTGLSSITYGAWTLHEAAGFVVGGVALIVLDWAVSQR